jgi:hypothetical protein
VGHPEKPKTCRIYVGTRTKNGSPKAQIWLQEPSRRRPAVEVEAVQWEPLGPIITYALFCWHFETTCLSASEFSVYFYYLFKILVCMYVRWLHAYVLTDPFLNLYLLPVVSAYLTPSSQLPSFPTNLSRIQQQYLPKMHLSFLFKCRELFNWRICFPMKYFMTELASSIPHHL